MASFIFLAVAYDGGWPVLSLTVSSPTKSVGELLIAEMAEEVEQKPQTKLLPWLGFEGQRSGVL